MPLERMTGASLKAWRLSYVPKLTQATAGMLLGVDKYQVCRWEHAPAQILPTGAALLLLLLRYPNPYKLACDYLEIASVQKSEVSP